jgi:cytochrome P450
MKENARDGAATAVEKGRVAPGPRGMPVLGNLNDFRNKDLIQVYVDTWRRYGDVSHLRAGPIDMVVAAHPDDVKHVLVDNQKNYIKGRGFEKVRLILGNGLFTGEGEVWRRHRRTMQPPFTPRNVTQFAPAMTAAITRLLERWAPHADSGQPFNVHAEMMRLAMSVIARTTLSADIDEEAAEAGHEFTYALDFISRTSVGALTVPLWVPTSGNRRFRQALAYMDRFIYGVIADHRRQTTPPNDLLTILLNARDPETGAGMDEAQIRDEMLTIFFAGHETTAQALTWTWYLLAQHPEVEAKLYDEVDRTLTGRLPTPDDTEALDYPGRVVQEAMRLYPPVWVFTRDALGDDELSGYRVPAGSMVVLSQYLTHRHPDFWPAAESFDPERFTPEQDAARPRYAYFPFGGGPRICLGNNFALLEASLAVAMVAQRYRLRLVPGQDIRPTMKGTLRPNGPVMMTAEKR